MKQQKLFLALAFQLMSAALFAQIGFVNKANLLTPSDHYSGVAIAVIDMNGDGLDDIVRLQLGLDLNVQYQNGQNQAFSARQFGLLQDANQSQWGMCTADIDNNGYADVLAGGFYDGVKIVSASDDGSSFSTVNHTQPETFVQGVNFADINNDGWLDAFVCHDDGMAKVFGNNGDGTFTYQPVWMDLATFPVSDNSGNYGSVWSDVDNDGDVDLYIAHCRQGVNDSTDPRRINQLFLNNGDGTYSQDIADVTGLRIGAQSWTADFGDIDNDGDFDCFITNHDVSSQLLENDGTGHFTDISVNAGIQDAIQGLPIQGVFRDFDNDGYVDILVAGNVQYLFKNNGDKTFSSVDNLFSFNAIESFAIGDMNGDGFQDIYAGYAEIYTDPSNIPDALWMNVGNNNHFFGMNLRGTQSNKGGVGAKVQLHSALGIQTREVRSGESYGISNSLQIHFGLGQVETIDSVVVNWPSGIRDVINNPTRDQYLTFGEGGCLLPAFVATPNGPTTFCTGESVDLTAPDGFSYVWSTGELSQTITVQDAGEYKVTVTAQDGCTAVSARVFVVVDPIEIPTITATGDSIFCKGGSMLLTATPAAGYLWSNGATTQSITVTDAGTYSVTTQGLCAQFASISSVTATTLAAILPIAMSDTVALDSAATLTAEGALLHWYDAQNAAVPLFTGSPFVTPALGQSTTFWVSNTTIYDQPNEFVGMINHMGAVTSDNSFNGGLIFDCFTPVMLARTKVYTAKAGDRKIVLLDVAGQLLQSKTVNIPIGTTIIDLGFELPVGQDFRLTTDGSVNQTVLGTNGPQLRRSNQGCEYPYELPGVISIKNSTFDENRFYYFFDWELDFKGYECESDRVAVNAVVATSSGTSNPTWASDIQLSPNPTTGLLNVLLNQFEGGKLQVTVKSLQGATLQTIQLESVAGPFEFRTDLSRFPKGIYTLELASEKGTVLKKVVVQ